MQGTSLCLPGPEEWSVWTHCNSPQRLFVCLDQTKAFESKVSGLSEESDRSARLSGPCDSLLEGGGQLQSIFRERERELNTFTTQELQLNSDCL